MMVYLNSIIFMILWNMFAKMNIMPSQQARSQQYLQEGANNEQCHIEPQGVTLHYRYLNGDKGE